MKRKECEISGILLGLHGAMVTEFCEDSEGELLARLRDAAGYETPIAITLDLSSCRTKPIRICICASAAGKLEISCSCLGASGFSANC